MNRRTTLAVSLSALAWTARAAAQTQPSPTPQFDVLGFIEEATLDTEGAICTPADPALAGGTVTVNGVRMIVPCNTIVQMPANTLTWAQLFDPSVSASVPPGGPPAQAPGQTGLALADVVPPTSPLLSGDRPFPSFEIRAAGNVVNGRYVVGLIAPISQQGLNGGMGYVRCIDYVNGFLYVGGAERAPGESCSAANGARVQMNDPVGRWGLPHSPDPRFSGDTANTTMATASGYPICVPRSDPALEDDPLCPRGNRPLNGDPRFPLDPFLPLDAPLRAFDMPPPPGLPGADPSGFPDARQQLPVMVGDWIEYAGTLFRDPIDLTTHYVSAHTINDVLGVFTAPGVPPVYVNVEGILLGTGGQPVANILQEATNRIFVVGFTTDPTSLVDVNALDYDPCTGEPSLRLLGTVDPLTQPVRGRFRFHVLGGNFLPATREMVLVSHARSGEEPPYPQPGWAGPIAANGLQSGQYLLPNFDFIFVENQQFGQPILPNNFQDMPFLAQGSGPLFGEGPLVGQLDPWPGDPRPPAVACGGGGASPTVDLGGNPSPFVVASQDPVALVATLRQGSGAGPATIAWIQTFGPAVTLTGADTLSPTFVAPTVPAGTPPVQLGFQLQVTDAFGSVVSPPLAVTVVGATDTLTAAAVWRAPRLGPNGVRGNKGGLLSVTATSTVLDPAVVLTVVGFGPMTNLGGGNFFFKVTGVPVPPATVTVRSSLGGSATADVTVR